MITSIQATIAKPVAPPVFLKDGWTPKRPIWQASWHATKIKNAIIDVTAEVYGIGRHDLLGSRKHKRLVVARRDGMLAMRNSGHFSYPQITRAFGRIDHTTAIHGCAKAREDVDSKASAILRMAKRLVDMREASAKSTASDALTMGQLG